MSDDVDLVINKKERANSYEVGKTGNRFKLCFDTAEELDLLIKDLREKGFNIETSE